jgi:methylenetetrahydrofolate dehydrogenase (NADP+) / methenyltetrahydrofolate cyclohydrolase
MDESSRYHDLGDSKSARILDGNVVAAEIRQQVKEEMARVKKNKGVVPGLAIVLVNSPVSRKSIAQLKKRTCDSVGVYCEIHELNSLTRQEEVEALIRKLNSDPKIHGINLHPMPNHINFKELIQVVDPHKDVEGLHPENMGNFLLGDKTYVPFTPRGIMKLIEKTGIEFKGKRVVIVGRSQHVGLPIGFLLLEQHATVTFAHSRSWYLEQATREADILVVATGHPEMINGDMVKPGAVVIDVGISMVGGHFVGDVEHNSVSRVAGWITPVPGGVGPMTIAMLLLNLVRCCE